MGIDINARQRLLNRQKEQALAKSFGDINHRLDHIDYSSEIDSLNKKLNTVDAKLTQEIAASIKQLVDNFQTVELTQDQYQQLKQLAEKIGTQLPVLEEIKQGLNQIKIPDTVVVSNIEKMPAVEIKNLPKTPEFPKTMEVYGNVNATIQTLPSVAISNLRELATFISNLQTTTLQAMRALKVEIPKTFEISKEVKISEWSLLLEGIEELKKGFNLLINKDTGENGLRQVEVTNFPIPKIPTPVTHISINAVNGFIKTTAATVTTNLTVLPTYGVLANRRSMILYNNGSVTIFIGGSDVTSSNGLPVPARTYSPPLDNGINTILYGVTASGSADVRIMELSDINSGT